MAKKQVQHPLFFCVKLKTKENAGESLNSSNISTLSGGEGEGSKNNSKRTICILVIRIEACVVKFSSFRPSWSSVPRS